MSRNESNIEIEYKFWAGKLSKEEFHDKIKEVAGNIKEPLYVCSCDDYYSGRQADSFLRHRKGSGQTELTLKVKRQGNVVRKEVNLSLNGNDDSNVVEFLKLSGYDKEFSVFKEAWIWEFSGDNPVDVSYYTLSDGRSVIEIEATSYETTLEGVASIDYWTEKLGLFSSFGLKRESRSLFEIFTEEKVEADLLYKGIELD